MYSISILLPYFTRGTGHWPDFIDWFFASCKANSTVNFQVFTDDKSISRWESADNIDIHYMTFEECIDLIHTKLGDVKIDKPYKLCDYRPAFGIIFEDFIKEYDFWGNCDCDLLFGDIREFYPDDLLDKYDKLNVQGPLQLSKNNIVVNKYYCLPRPADSKDKDFTWEKVSGTAEHFGFDEWSGAPRLAIENGKAVYWDLKIFSNIYQPVKDRKHMYNHVLEKNDSANKPFQVWQWKDGHIYHIDMLSKKKKSKLYIHFTERKMITPEYTNQEEIYITQGSEFKDKISFKDSIVGFDYVRLMTRKVFVWIGWKLTHLTGKKSWEM